MRRIRTVAQLRQLGQPKLIKQERCTMGVECEKAGRCYAKAVGNESNCPLYVPTHKCTGCGYSPNPSGWDATVCCPEKRWAKTNCPKCNGEGIHPAYTDRLGWHRRRCDCDILYHRR